MNTSVFTQIHEGILIEYEYTDRNDPFKKSFDDYKVEILKNSATNDIYFFNDPSNFYDTFNIRDISALKIGEYYVHLNRNLPLQYVDYNSDLTPSTESAVTDFPPTYEIKYDNVKIHFANNLNFGSRDAFIFEIQIKRRDNIPITLATIIYRKVDDYAILNPTPKIIGEILYNRYINLTIPSTYFLSIEDKFADNLNAKLTNQLGFLSNPLININLREVTKTEKINSYFYYTSSQLQTISINSRDEFEGLSAVIMEATDGDYYQMFGEYNNIIYEDFINQLNLQPNSDYTVYHEVTVNEQVGDQYIETARTINVQNSDFGKPFKFRPIIENATNAVSYSIQYILRLINRIDNTQIIKAAQLVSFDVKKYGKNLKKLNVGIPPIINKVYNKIEQVNYDSSTLMVGTDTLLTATLNNTEYINVFRDRFNIVISTSNINIDNFSNSSISKDYKLSGSRIIQLNPYDSFVLFNFYRSENEDFIPINLNLYGDIYLNFIDNNDEIKIKFYEKVTDLNDYQRIFKIAKDDARKILNFSNKTFYITSKIQRIDEESDEGILFSGIWY